MGEKSKLTRRRGQGHAYNKTLTLPLHRAFLEDNEDLETGLCIAGIIVLIQKAEAARPWCLDRLEPVLIIPIGDSLVRGFKIYPDQLKGLNQWKQCVTLILKLDGSNLSRLALDLGTTAAATKLLEELPHSHPAEVSYDKPGRMISKWIRSKKENGGCKGSPCTERAEETDAASTDADTPNKANYKEDKRLMRFLIPSANDNRFTNDRIGYHTAYCNFITRNTDLDRAALREKITHTLSWPKFLMEHFGTFPCSELSGIGHEMLVALVMQAVSSRKCALKSCNEFSLLKCRACKSSYYCNKSCQSLDVEHHQNVCVVGDTAQAVGTQGSNVSCRGDYHGRSFGIQLRRGLADLRCIPRKTLTLKEFKHIMGLRMLERGVKYFASRGVLKNIATQAGFKFQLTIHQVKQLIVNHSRSLTADKFEKQLLSSGYVVPTRTVNAQASLEIRKTRDTLKRLNNEAKFICKPKLLAVLKTVDEDLQRKDDSSLVVFRFKDILMLLRRYLIKNARKFKMDKSKMVIEGDPLSEALGVSVLHSNQIPKHLLDQLIQYTVVD